MSVVRSTPTPTGSGAGSLEERLDRLRRDVVGADRCLRGPFGPRRICYADHIASGRPLASVEDAVRDGVLPAYANTHTEDSFTGARTIDRKSVV